MPPGARSPCRADTYSAAASVFPRITDSGAPATLLAPRLLGPEGLGRAQSAQRMGIHGVSERVRGGTRVVSVKLCKKVIVAEVM